MTTKKKKVMKSVRSLSKKVFIVFDAQTTHSVNKGNQNLEADLPILQFKSRKISDRNVRNKVCVYPALALQCWNVFHILENYFASTGEAVPSKRKGTELTSG